MKKIYKLFIFIIFSFNLFFSYFMLVLYSSYYTFTNFKSAISKEKAIKIIKIFEKHNYYRFLLYKISDDIYDISIYKYGGPSLELIEEIEKCDVKKKLD